LVSGFNMRVPEGEGRIINPLINNGNKVIFAQFAKEGIGFGRFYQLDLSEEKKRREYFVKKNRLPIKLNNVTDWAFDKNNNLRFVENKTNSNFIYWYQNPETNKWFKIAEKRADEIKQFFMLDSQERVLALIKENDDKAALAYFSTKNLDLLEIVYSHPDYDVESPILGMQNELIGAIIINDGVRQEIFFDQDFERVQADILSLNNLNTGYIVDSSADRNRLLVLGSKNGIHFKYYDYNRTTKKLKFTTDPRPWLKNVNLPSTVTEKLTKDQNTIEAYLTLPLEKPVNGYPLLVMPHGGPFGIRDYKIDNEAIYLAHKGYAVLRVNFRGSSGFGKKFIDSAKLGTGTIIEEDIFFALQRIIEKYPINEKRMCSFGTSYGGYSTAMLLAKHPNLFQCGISFAGVFDFNLQMNESKRFTSYREELDNFFKEYIADIENSPELQKTISPIYYADKIQVPLLLLHGDKDEIVDYEQSYRMHHALQQKNKISELKILEGFPHGYRNLKQVEEYFSIVEEFLQRNLN